MAIRLWGQQTIANAVTLGVQDQPAIAALTNGNLIVVWRDASRGTGDIYARLLGPTGAPISDEFTIKAGVDVQQRPAIAAKADGGFAVTYQTGNQIEVVEYTAAGAFVRAAFVPGINGTHPSIVADTAPGVTIAYKQDASVRVARFDNAGAFLSDIILNTQPAVPMAPDIARLFATTYVVTWLESTFVAVRRGDQAGNLSTIYYANDSVTDIDLASADAQPKVTPLEAGTVLVTWHAQNGSSIDVMGRLINMSSGPIGDDDFVINRRLAGSQWFSETVTLKDGGFMVIWSDDGNVLRAQVFDPSGGREGAEIIINPVGGVFSFNGIEAAVMPDGRVAVVWNGYGASGDSDGVYMQIIDPRDGYVEGSTAAETLYGHDTGEDLILGRDGADTIAGLGGNDSIYAGAGADTVEAGFGDDVVNGGPGADLIRGDLGNDLIYGDGDDDVVGAGAGHDLVFGGLGNDWLEGGADNDTMLGEGGGDRLEGQDGNDVLDGGPGDDVLIGGTGNDIFYVDSLGDQVIEAPGGGIDIAYSSAGWLGNANVENLVLTGSAALNATMNGDANLVAGNGAANVINGAGGNDTIDGLGGNDWLGGGDGADRLDGGADNDTIQGGVGADALYGGAGADSFYYGSYLDSNATQGIDSIQDFQVGVDKINLTPARLSSTDSVTITPAYGNAYVYVDLYGDGINDMIIEVIGATTLSGSDLSFVAPAASAIYYGDDAYASQTIVTEAMAAFRGSWVAVI